MVSHVRVPINIYNLYNKACEYLLKGKFQDMINVIIELNSTKKEELDYSKYVIVDINDWQDVFNAGVACWMGQNTISRLTLEKTINSSNKVKH